MLLDAGLFLNMLPLTTSSSSDSSEEAGTILLIFWGGWPLSLEISLRFIFSDALSAQVTVILLHCQVGREQWIFLLVLDQFVPLPMNCFVLEF